MRGFMRAAIQPAGPAGKNPPAGRSSPERLLFIDGLRGVAALAVEGDAPWEAAGQLVARFHRAGLDHADLNAHNLLFNAQGKGWMIDFDQCQLRIPATAWRQANLQRLQRSLLKVRGERSAEEMLQGFARLRRAYDLVWNRGY